MPSGNGDSRVHLTRYDMMKAVSQSLFLELYGRGITDVFLCHTGHSPTSFPVQKGKRP